MDLKSANPFSPDFGTPRQFFGRVSYLDMMREALGPGHRPNRSVIIEGVRGTGKTALLGRLRDLASGLGWDTVYTISRDDPRELVVSIDSLGRHLPRSLSANLETPFVGGGIGLGPSPVDPSRSLTTTLTQHLERSGKGLLLLIDEAQKLSESYAQEVCIALNAAREEGLDVALVVAGLPGLYQRISQFDRCTYMARSTHRFLPMLTVSETLQAFGESFEQVPEMDVAPEMIEAMAAYTKGHPYLVQLLGYDLYEQAATIARDLPGRYLTVPIQVTPEMLAVAEDYAWANYSRKVLDLVLGKYRNGTVEYLRALAETMDADGLMNSGDEVAKRLGKEKSKELSSYRARLIAAGVLKSQGYGKLSFRIPYIPRYLEEGPSLPEEDPGDYFPL